MRTGILALVLLASPASALYEGLQCVPYARAVSGVEIRGDAHSWWDQAAGHYARGNAPRVGAVLAFRPHGNMRLGHVAAVRKIVDKRTILISHANWSTINGVRGHIENDVQAVDVSPANDWSQVRVWYSPNAALGTTVWPVHGFIYPAQTRNDRDVRVAVQALVGTGSATITPTSTTKPRPAITLAATKSPPAKRAGLSLSSSVLAEISALSAKERNRAKPV